ncbi:MAG: ABC transporter permease, partial [Gammaproteobacteria bacterium]|nr:ABC transporter permease [Gammaproteobacteria bacterium]
MNSDNDKRLNFSTPDKGELCVSLIGDWDLKDRLPPPGLFPDQVKSQQGISRIAFDSEQIGAWDSSLLVFIGRVEKYCSKNSLQLDMSGLPRGVKRLRELAQAIPPIEDTATHETIEPLLNEIGKTTLELYHGVPRNLEFIGDVILSFGRLLRNKAQFRSVELMLIIQQVGPNALPIVSLVSFLVGLILAYMGAAQLERVGVQIYIADLVGIAMIREVGALMTGIIMAGRTGASFAAELGTMQVNEEIDAFKTLGISTIDFLVLPRVLALMLMIPLLT